jgi:hypothetical protein
LRARASQPSERPRSSMGRVRLTSTEALRSHYETEPFGTVIPLDWVHGEKHIFQPLT